MKVYRIFLWILWNPVAQFIYCSSVQYLVQELCRELCSCIHTLFSLFPLVLQGLIEDISVSFTVLLQLSHLLQQALHLLLLMLQCPFQPLCHSTLHTHMIFDFTSMKTMTKVKIQVGLLESEPPADYFQLLSCAADSASDCGWIQDPLTALLQSSDALVITMTKHLL